jgi:hypothetical protein
MVKHSSLLCPVVSNEQKRFVELTSGPNFIKNYISNLRIFVISYSFCPRQSLESFLLVTPGSYSRLAISTNITPGWMASLVLY